MVTKTHEHPPRLICSDCGRVVPQSTVTPVLALLDRHWAGLLALLLLIAAPVLLMTIGPWSEQRPVRRQTHPQTHPQHRHRVDLVPLRRRY
jgi:hypothetical protein